MSKILALSNIELKKNQKFYSIYCATIFVSILTINLFYIFQAAGMYEVIEAYKNKVGGVVYGALIFENNMPLKMILFLGIVGAILYTALIWLRDWKGSHKNIYTYLMIPGNRINLYFAKILNSLFFTYMVLVCETIALFLSKYIFNAVFISKSNIIDTSFNSDLSFISDIMFINTNGVDFFVENILFTFVAISVISTLMIIIMSMKNKVLATLLIGASIFIASIFGINLGTASSKIYQLLLNLKITDSMVVANIIISIIILIICTGISYFLSNRKMSV